ncbi:MAG: ribonuclease HII [Ignavibacteria bacterium]|jgi:ribonuclease HII|nr:ribonuclease HII [Ignavibacteria bacterium]
MKIFDDKFREDGYKIIAGVDEAGRGPLAGPVVAAAVVFDDNTYIEGINDSKKLSAKIRSELFEVIIQKALSYSYSIIPHTIIDSINILQASLLAMKNSVNGLQIRPDIVLIDGNKTFPSQSKTLTIVKGDTLSQSIAAASIVAKVIRDEYMKELSYSYQNYGWHQNKGYPTKLHIKAVNEYGITPFHRKSFLKKILSEEQLGLL